MPPRDMRCGKTDHFLTGDYGRNLESKMLCFNCKQRPATHFIKKDGEDAGLCDECYERLGEAAKYAGSEPDFFVSFLEPDEKQNGRKCPNCGMTLDDYTHSGLVGCAVCYEVFRQELLPVIRRIQGKTTHEGKRPLGVGTVYELLEVQKRLRSELERALKEKRMKDAEKLNRDIREISRMIERGKEGGNDDQ